MSPITFEPLHQFSPNFHQRCILPTLRTLLKIVDLDLNLQGRLDQLKKMVNLVHFDFVTTITFDPVHQFSPRGQARWGGAARRRASAVRPESLENRARPAWPDSTARETSHCPHGILPGGNGHDLLSGLRAWAVRRAPRHAKLHAMPRRENGTGAYLISDQCRAPSPFGAIFASIDFLGPQGPPKPAPSTCDARPILKVGRSRHTRVASAPEWSCCLVIH